MQRIEIKPTMSMTLALITLKERSLEDYRDHGKDKGLSVAFGNGGGFGREFFGVRV